MRTKTARTLRRIVAALCAATVLLGVLVLSTSAQEPSERATADIPFGYGYEPITDPYLYCIPVSLSTSKGYFSCYLDREEFIGDTVGDFGHNFAWLSVTYEGQDENGDIAIFTATTAYCDCYYLAYAEEYQIDTDPYTRVYITTNDRVYFSILYENVLPYPDSIVEAYVYIGLNPLRYGYDSNTSGGNTDEAYQEGFENGLIEGYDNGYSDGYDTASSEIENQSALGLFGRGILDGLLDIYFDTFRIPIFGTSLGEILGYFIFFIWVLVVVKIVSFVI